MLLRDAKAPSFPRNLDLRQPFVSKRPKTYNGHPVGWPLCLSLEKSSYRSLFQLIRSPRVVVELETGCLWLSFL